MATINESAYSKLILHGAKYSSKPISGVFLGKINGDQITITDALPLFHSHVLAPLLEASFLQIDEYCNQNQLEVVGMYFGNETSALRKLSPMASKIGEKIISTKHNNNIIIALIDDQKLENPKEVGLQSFSWNQSSKEWKSSESEIQASQQVLEKAQQLLASKSHYLLNDFEDHIDDISKDWIQNQALKL